MKFTFKGGIHPLHDAHEGKAPSRDKPVRSFIPETVCIPTNMHLGPHSIPCVKKGDQVKLGQIIAEAAGPRCIPAHASVSGTVLEVANKQMLGKMPCMCITISNDFKDEWVELNPLGDVETCPKDQIIGAIQAAGISGMGGACFPTHAKMMIPEGKSIDTILLNGAECETFLTSDYRLMLEQPERVVNGLRAAMRAMNVSRGIIGIEDNKQEAIDAMTKAATGRTGIEVKVLKTKYPQGGEKQLIDALLKREVPSSKLPMDANVVVLNVATAAAIADAVIEGKPLIQRITTVTGCVHAPDNLLVRLGTSYADAIAFCGGYSETPGKILAGGTMTGNCAPHDAVSIIKGTNGIVVLNEKDAVLKEEMPCIRCGKCIDACPIHLEPYKLKYLCDAQKLDQAQETHVMDCILCGSCSYACPAMRKLSAAFKDAKEMIAARRK